MINNKVERAKWALSWGAILNFYGSKFKLITIRWILKHKLQTKRSISISMQTDQFSVEFWLLCGEGKTLLIKVCVSDRGKIDFEFYLLNAYENDICQNLHTREILNTINFNYVCHMV